MDFKVGEMVKFKGIYSWRDRYVFGIIVTEKISRRNDTKSNGYEYGYKIRLLHDYKWETSPYMWYRNKVYYMVEERLEKAKKWEFISELL